MYGATFLLLILLAKLSVEHRTLGNVSVDRNGLLAFEQEYFHCVTVGFEIRFDVGCQQTSVVVRGDVKQYAITLANRVQQLCAHRTPAVDRLQVVHHVRPPFLENEIGRTAVPWIWQKIYDVAVFYGLMCSIHQCVIVVIMLPSH